MSFLRVKMKPPRKKEKEKETEKTPSAFPQIFRIISFSPKHGNPVIDRAPLLRRSYMDCNLNFRTTRFEIQRAETIRMIKNGYHNKFWKVLQAVELYEVREDYVPFRYFH
ncbi:hypothetical protein CEXT_152581 [Caerostris extrusa]|uniref:Uncharacterized protein n=1 Tax=Caerostris extrusa TaxID=172846 RepID=A0AAV4SK70_CAEEX|nr:hypothetical protein CEXT_152581 [Caerostris extrusa]